MTEPSLEDDTLIRAVELLVALGSDPDTARLTLQRSANRHGLSVLEVARAIIALKADSRTEMPSMRPANELSDRRNPR